MNYLNEEELFLNDFQESKINDPEILLTNPVTFKPPTLDLRISCLMNHKNLMSKEGFLEKKGSGFFKSWHVINLFQFFL